MWNERIMYLLVQRLVNFQWNISIDLLTLWHKISLPTSFPSLAFQLAGQKDRRKEEAESSKMNFSLFSQKVLGPGEERGKISRKKTVFPLQLQKNYNTSTFHLKTKNFKRKTDNVQLRITTAKKRFLFSSIHAIFWWLKWMKNNHLQHKLGKPKNCNWTLQIVC